MHEAEARTDLGHLRSAICDTTDRHGNPRIAAKTAEALLKCISARARGLPGLARQAVRLTVAFDRLNPRGYVDTLHGKLPILRSRTIRAYISQSHAPGIRWQSDMIHLEGPGMKAISGEPFTMSAAQASLAAAYLDAAHAMLGFSVVANIIAPAIDGGDAEPVAHDLHRAILDWLHSRLDREHLGKQASAIRNFLEAREAVTADKVNNEIIFDFWFAQAIDPTGIDGFKLWMNAVRQVMIYRLAMLEAADLYRINNPRSSDQAPEFGGIDLTATNHAVLEAGAWVSPLAQIQKPGTQAIKWLKALEVKEISTLLPVDNGDDDTRSGVKGSAFADGQPDAAFLRTWLRFSLFGPFQNRIIQALRGKVAVAEYDGGSYATLVGRFKEHHNTLQIAIEATVWDLMRRAPVDGLALAQTLEPQAVTQLLKRTASEEKIVVGEDLWPAAARHFLEDGGPLATRCAKSFRFVNRAGFRDEDAENEAMGEAMRNGAPWLPLLADELGRVLDWAGRQDLVADFTADFEKFKAAFESIYQKTLAGYRHGDSPENPEENYTQQAPIN